MSLMRKLFTSAVATGATLAASMLATTSPAAAQFFFKSPDMSGPRVTAITPTVGEVLPDATAEEQEAALVWNLRAGLNVAALQCQFEPTLLTLPAYNAILADHKDELAKSFGTLEKYFKRVNKTAKAGQTALDQYGTRVYSSYSTVGAQLTFCQAAGRISQQAIFAPRGSFAEVAQLRLAELRNSLKLAGEQHFRGVQAPIPSRLPSMDKKCWKKDEYRPDRCGSLAPLGYASRN